MMDSLNKNIIITGPQASGKGTQASLLKKKLGLAHLSTGAVLRKIAKENTPLGREVDKYINQKGALAPDKTLAKVVKNFLTKENLKKGIVFDGIPRSTKQLDILERLLKEKKTSIDKVFYLTLSEEEILRRLSGRLVCPKCGENYNFLTRPPKKEEVCDICKTKLGRRKDEYPEAIKNRLAIYRRKTLPVLDIYRKRGILEEVDGERPVEEIFEDILERIKKASSTR